MDYRSSFTAPSPRLLLSVLILLLLPITLFGQQLSPPESQSVDPVNEEELKQFASAVKGVQSIQQRMQKESEQVITESPLSRDRFMEIFRSEQAEGSTDPVSVTSDEQQVYDSTLEEIRSLQNSAQEDMIGAVTDTGLSLDRYSKILNAVQSDPALMERLQPYLQGDQS